MDTSEKGQRPFDKDMHTRLRDQANKPLARFDAWSWGEVQMWDNGPRPEGAHAYVRFKLKIRHSTAPVQHLARVQDRYTTAQPTRYVHLSSIKNYRRNCRRLVERPSPREQAIIDHLIDTGGAIIAEGVEGRPEPLAGYVMCKFEGTRRFAGQHAIVAWNPGESGVWLPVVVLSQFDLSTSDDRRLLAIGLDLPPQGDRGASAATWVGQHFGEEYAAHMEAGKKAKEEREAIAGRWGEAP